MSGAPGRTTGRACRARAPPAGRAELRRRGRQRRPRACTSGARLQRRHAVGVVQMEIEVESRRLGRRVDAASTDRLPPARNWVPTRRVLRLPPLLRRRSRAADSATACAAAATGVLAELRASASSAPARMSAGDLAACAAPGAIEMSPSLNAGAACNGERATGDAAAAGAAAATSRGAGAAAAPS